MSQENKEIVEKINKAMAEGDTDAFLAYCSEDVKWTMYGDRTVQGKSAIKEWMSSMDCPEPPDFTVDYMLADGDSVVATGDMTMKDKDGQTLPYAYCDIYRFSGAQVVELRTFVVATTEANRSAAA